MYIRPVSYTHLDVYKRQVLVLAKMTKVKAKEKMKETEHPKVIGNRLLLAIKLLWPVVLYWLPLKLLRS